MRTLKLEYEDARDLVLCQYSGHADFHHLMKYTFPKSLRIWDPDQKKWAVKPNGLTYLLRLTKLYVDSLDINALPEFLQQLCREYSPKPSVSDGAMKDPHHVLHLLPSAPFSVIRAAFLALSKEHHPDKGGDPEYFLRIKEAYENLRGRD